MQPRILTLPAVTLPNDGEAEIRIPTGEAIVAAQVHITAAFSSSNDVPVPHEDGAAAFIRSVSLQPSGPAHPISNISGFALARIAEYDQGGPLAIDDLSPVQNDDGTLELVLPIRFCAPGSRSPLSWLWDPRGLAEQRLIIRTRAIDDIVGTTTETFDSASATVSLHTIMGVPPMGSKLPNGERLQWFERRLVQFERVISGSGPVQPITLKRPGWLRRLWIIARDDAPPTGDRSDDIIDRITLRRDSNDVIVTEFPWMNARELTSLVRDVDLGLGVAVVDLDPENLVDSESFLISEAIDALDLELEALAAGHVTVVAEYTVIRSEG